MEADHGLPRPLDHPLAELDRLGQHDLLFGGEQGHLADLLEVHADRVVDPDHVRRERFQLLGGRLLERLHVELGGRIAGDVGSPTRSRAGAARSPSRRPRGPVDDGEVRVGRRHEAAPSSRRRRRRHRRRRDRRRAARSRRARPRRPPSPLPRRRAGGASGRPARPPRADRPSGPWSCRASCRGRRAPSRVWCSCSDGSVAAPAPGVTVIPPKRVSRVAAAARVPPGRLSRLACSIRRCSERRMSL